MGICEAQSTSPTTLVPTEHKSTLRKSTRLSISKVSWTGHQSSQSYICEGGEGQPLNQQSASVNMSPQVDAELT